MINIRKGVFETNSSSSHSIVLMNDDKPADKKIDADWRVNEDGVMDFWFEDDLNFGRTPFDLLTDWYGRLRYAIASNGYRPEKLDELREVCRKRIKNFKDFKFKEDRWEHGEYHGYVDHQSLGLLDAALDTFDTNIEDFIFNDKFIVVIDGDEYCVFNTLMHTGMFNKESVKDILSASYEIEEEYWHGDDGEEK